MTRIFTVCGAENGTLILTGENAAHISRSLRMKPGEKLMACDGRGNDFFCTIAGFTSDSVTLTVDKTAANEAEPEYKATLYMALPKSDKMELIVQKSVETGVYTIVPFISEFCISRPDLKSMENKLSRWRKISENAACQSGRGIIPEIKPLIDFDEALRQMRENSDLPFICYECEREKSLRALLESKRDKKSGNIAFMVGAEGGFSEKECRKFQKAGIDSVTLGKRILRCETAPVFVLSSLSLMFDC